jgi:hypothetical protein
MDHEQRLAALEAIVAKQRAVKSSRYSGIMAQLMAAPEYLKLEPPYSGVRAAFWTRQWRGVMPGMRRGGNCRPSDERWKGGDGLDRDLLKHHRRVAERVHCTSKSRLSAYSRRRCGSGKA